MESTQGNNTVQEVPNIDNTTQISSEYDKQIQNESITWDRKIFSLQNDDEYEEIQKIISQYNEGKTIDDYLEENTTEKLSNYILEIEKRIIITNKDTTNNTKLQDLLQIIHEIICRYDERHQITGMEDQQDDRTTKYFHRRAQEAFDTAYRTDEAFRTKYDTEKALYKKALSQYIINTSNTVIGSNVLSTKSVSDTTTTNNTTQPTDSTVNEKNTVKNKPKNDISRYGQQKDNYVYSTQFQILLNNKGKFTIFHTQKAAIILACMLLTHIEPSHPVIRQLIQWCNKQFDVNSQYTMQAQESIKILLRSKKTHIAYHIEEGLLKLTKLINQEKPVQIIYNACFCLWMLSYNPLFDEQIEQTYIIRDLVQLSRSTSREKIIRICFYIFSNLIERGTFAQHMIGANIQHTIQQLKQRQLNDENLVSNILNIDDIVKKKVSEQSSFDKYLAEQNAGAQRRSPVHTEKFWRENFQHFENNSFALIKKIAQQLSSNNKESVEMACNDLAEFARFHPQGKEVLGTDIKNKLFILMDTNDPIISRAALLALQKILLRRWERIQPAPNTNGLSLSRNEEADSISS